jgi:hypothetical protein
MTTGDPHISPSSPAASSTPAPPSPASPPPPEDTDPSPADRSRRPVFGTILWGVILVVFAAAVGARTLPGLDPPTVVLAVGGLVVLGVLLVCAGIAALLRGSSGRAS